MRGKRGTGNPYAASLSDHDIESADDFNRRHARNADARFRGRMLDALERGRERLPGPGDLCGRFGLRFAGRRASC